MAQQAFDSFAVAADISARQEPAAPSPLPGWRSLPQALIRAHGEEGYVDLAALDAARGVALVCFLDKDEEASPQEAQEALRAMLREEGIEERFPGELPVIALAVPRTEAEALGALIDRAFADAPRPSLPAGWVEWVAERLAPDRAAPVEPLPPPRLVAPPREEPPLAKPADELVVAAPEREPTPPEKTEASVLDLVIEAPAEAAQARASLLDWGTSLGFAVGMVAALLLGLAMISYNARLF